MIVNDKDAVARLNSPMNLINRLKSTSRKDSMSLFGIGRKIESSTPQLIPAVTEKETVFNPFRTEELSTSVLPSSSQVPAEAKLDNIIENHESQIKLGLAHDNALKLLNNSIDALSAKLDDVRADKLPSVISAASKTVESIRKERNEASKNSKDHEVHYHFYTPEQKKISDYEVIDVA